jgi:hypothetical protein
MSQDQHFTVEIVKRGGPNNGKGYEVPPYFELIRASGCEFGDLTSVYIWAAGLNFVSLRVFVVRHYGKHDHEVTELEQDLYTDKVRPLRGKRGGPGSVNRFINPSGRDMKAAGVQA